MGRWSILEALCKEEASRRKMFEKPRQTIMEALMKHFSENVVSLEVFQRVPETASFVSKPYYRGKGTSNDQSILQIYNQEQLGSRDTIDCDESICTHEEECERSSHNGLQLGR